MPELNAITVYTKFFTPSYCVVKRKALQIIKALQALSRIYKLFRM